MPCKAYAVAKTKQKLQSIKRNYMFYVYKVLYVFRFYYYYVFIVFLLACWRSRPPTNPKDFSFLHATSIHATIVEFSIHLQMIEEIKSKEYKRNDGSSRGWIKGKQFAAQDRIIIKKERGMEKKELEQSNQHYFISSITS